MEVPEDHFKSKDPGFCLIKIISKSRDFSHITGNYSVMFLYVNSFAAAYTLLSMQNILSWTE